MFCKDQIVDMSYPSADSPYRITWSAEEKSLTFNPHWGIRNVTFSKWVTSWVHKRVTHRDMKIVGSIPMWACKCSQWHLKYIIKLRLSEKWRFISIAILSASFWVSTIMCQRTLFISEWKHWR